MSDLLSQAWRRHHPAALALLHFLGLGLTARLAHWPYPVVLAALALVLLPGAVYSRLGRSASRRTLQSALTGLSPLFILYLVAALRVAVGLLTRAVCPACYTYLAVPEPFASWLSFEWTAIFCLALVAVIQCAQLLPAGTGTRLAAFALAVLTAGWVAVLYPRLVPAGVTGADPFAYVQMAVDLAGRGTPAHYFPLAELAHRLTLPVYPTLFVGYVVPQGGDSPSVWPPGFSALLALAYALIGESGLYGLNPILGVLSLAATAALARRAFGLPRFYALAAAAFLLTSLEQTVRLSVPLADIAAQLFTLAAVLVAVGSPPLATGAGERPARLQTLLCGALAALAFGTRYTQLLLVPGLLVALYRRSQTRSTAAQGLAAFWSQGRLFALSFLTVALPDTIYRTIAFGSPASFAAGELAQFSAAAIYPVALRLLAELALDFGLLAPFVLLGIAVLLRRRPGQTLVLVLILGPVTLFHLPYEYLKLRDLLFLLPFLYACAAAGVRLAVARWQALVGERSRAAIIFHLAGAAVIFLLPLAWRLASQLPLLGGYYTYGFLTAQGREQVDSIDALTPPDAVIAASLNSGAISLYARRETFRPGHLLQPGRTWTDAELVTFIRALRAQGRPVYLLADSEEMLDPIAALESCCILAPIAERYLPYYARDGSATNEIVLLYRLEFR